MVKSRRYFSSLLFSIMFITLLVTAPAHALPPNITVDTDKTSYAIGEIVNIYVNLTYGENPVQDGLVALQVDNPNNSTVICRTLQTATPPTPTEINFTEIAMWNASYHPTDIFKIGETGYLLIKVKNIIPPILGDVNGDYRVSGWDLSYLSDAWMSQLGDPNYNIHADFNLDDVVSGWDLSILSDNWMQEAPVLPVYTTMTMYDATNVPLIVGLFQFYLAPNVTQLWMPQFTIPQDASIGNAAVYASAFTGFPKDGGTAFCPEMSKTFQITESMSSSLSEQGGYQTTATSGDYGSTFKIRAEHAQPGTWTVYVASSYGVEQATATDYTTFLVT